MAKLKQGKKPKKTGKKKVLVKKQDLGLAKEATKPKHPGGRPPKFNTPEEIQEKIQTYFDSCWVDKVTETTAKDGTVTMTTIRYQDRPYTVSGLALALDMTTEGLREYGNKGEFSAIIKKAKLQITMCWEERLDGKNAAGPIFWLKNHAGYTDKQEVEHSGPGGAAIPVKLTDITDEDLLTIATRGSARTPQKAKSPRKSA